MLGNQSPSKTKIKAATDPVRACCLLARADVARIDRLVTNVRSQLNESPTIIISRKIILPALLLEGLQCASSSIFAPVALSKFSERLDYLLLPKELERLNTFWKAHRPSSTQQSFEGLQGALIQLSLPTAETSAVFAGRVLAVRRRHETIRKRSP